MNKYLLSIFFLCVLGTHRIFGQGDLCTGAIPSITCGNVYVGNTTALTADVAPFCTVADGTAGGGWYRMVGTGGSITFSLCGSSFDTRIRVYGPGGTCATMACVAGNDNFCGLQSQVTITSVIATNYRILVHGTGAAVGAYTLTVSCAPPPTPLCYSQTAVTYSADPYAGTALALTDDVHSSVLPMGFNFCYNGATYNSCVIASNNYITFDATQANLFSPYTTVAIPTATPTGPQNAILDPWQDINPGAGGSIFYTTSGVAPFRRFVVSYLNVPMFLCSGQLYSSQIVLYESSNCIESLILQKPICAAWNNGNAVQGLQNSTGSSAIATLGRNNTQWTATSEGRYYSPTCAPCSTAATAACIFVSLPVELLNFHGYKHGLENILEWTTASEQNTEYFIVDRSRDGMQFTSILQLDAAGYSASEIDYSANDLLPIFGMNYYRLRTVDFNGAEDISDVISIDNNESQIIVYPNPSQSNAQILIPNGMVYPITIKINDLTGRLVRTILVERSGQSLTIDGLVCGSYLMQIVETGETVRFTIE